MATTTKNISLDFYNNSIVNVYAKQSDANSRFINVTCTDHGQKVSIDKTYISAFVRMKKSDGTYIYHEVDIQDDGTILITLTNQMLIAYGKQVVDVVLLATPDITYEELNTIEAANNLSNVSVISVMPFYLIVQSSAVDNTIITSTSEFDALTTATARMLQLEKSVKNAEKIRVDSENERISNENTRISNENIRKNNENTRQANENNRKDAEKKREEAERKRQDDITGETFRITNEELRQSNEVERENTAIQKINEWGNAVNETIQKCEQNVDETINKCETNVGNTINKCESNVNDMIDKCKADTATAIKACEEVTITASAVVKEFETIKDFTGIIMQEEKGVANGVATLNEDCIIPDDQISISRFIQNNLTTSTSGYALDAAQGAELKKLIDNLPQILSGTSAPNSSIGKNGDIYLYIV